MPRLPFGISNAEIPTSTGNRGGMVQVPVIQDPGLDSDAATLGGRALAQFGEQVATTGQYLAQAEGYQFQRQRAQDVLDAKTELQETRQAFLAKYDELVQGDYRTLPEDMLKAGNQIMAERGRSLTPQARALYTEDAQQALTAMQQTALSERTKRRDQHTAYTMSREIQQVQELMLRTTDPYQREVLLGQYRDLSQQFVATGLVRGEVMADMEKKTMNALSDQQVQQMIQAFPDAMRQNLLAQITRQPTRADLPSGRPEVLAELHQQAVTVSRARFAEQEHQERYKAHQLKEQQIVNSRELTTRLYMTRMTPENVPKFEEIMALAAAGMKQGTLDERQGEHLMVTAQAHMQTAAKPPQLQDDEALASTLSLATRMAETPEEFERARTLLSTQALGRLKRNTIEDIYDALERRQAASEWRQLPKVRAAKDILMRGAMVPYGGTLAGIMKPQMQQKTSWAIDSWEEQLQTIWNTAPAQRRRFMVEQAAEALAWESRRQNLQPDINNEADAQEYLPPQVQRANTPVELAQEIHALRMLGWANGSLLIIRDNWHRWYNTWPKGPDGMPQRARSTTSSGTTAPTGAPTPVAPSNPYQLPGDTAPGQQGRRSN